MYSIISLSLQQPLYRVCFTSVMFMMGVSNAIDDKQLYSKREIMILKNKVINNEPITLYLSMSIICVSIELCLIHNLKMKYVRFL